MLDGGDPKKTELKKGKTNVVMFVGLQGAPAACSPPAGLLPAGALGRWGAGVWICCCCWSAGWCRRWAWAGLQRAVLGACTPARLPCMRLRAACSPCPRPPRSTAKLPTALPLRGLLSAGAGKTTTCTKYAYLFKKKGFKPAMVGGLAGAVAHYTNVAFIMASGSWFAVRMRQLPARACMPLGQLSCHEDGPRTRPNRGAAPWPHCTAGVRGYLPRRRV